MRIYVKLSKTCWKIEQIFHNYSQFTLSSLRRVIRFGALKFWNKKCVTEKWHFSKVLFLIQVRLPWTLASPVNKLQYHRKRSTILKITNIQKWNLLYKALELQILWHLTSKKDRYWWKITYCHYKYSWIGKKWCFMQILARKFPFSSRIFEDCAIETEGDSNVCYRMRTSFTSFWLFR